MKLLLPLLALTVVIPVFVSGDAPVIELVSGRVKGEEKESRDDRDFYAYRGIPYAKPPVGNLRFEPPQKPDNWTGVWDGEDYGKKCIQWSSYEKEVDGEENCLFINVFSPKFADGLSKKLLPVLVFIHGGDFMTGTADIYRAHYFMDQDVVAVTFNYRLGAFGFLSTGDGASNGNQGLKDQVMALQWVQDNIRKFAGDPKRVTIFGQGSGAVSVHMLMLSSMSKGLFKKAISQSATSLKYTSIQTHPLEAAQRLARKLHCDEVLSKAENATGDVKLEAVLNNTTLLVDCLRLVKAKKIAEVHQEAFGPLSDPLTRFIPTIEKPLKHFNDTNELPFLTEHPFSMMLSGRQAKIPWIVGFNMQEGLVTTGVILNDKSLVGYVEDNWDEVSSQLLSYPRSRTDLTKRIKKFYLSGKDYEFGDSNSTTGTPARPSVPLPPQPPQAQHVSLPQLAANKNPVPGHSQIHTSPTHAPILIPTQPPPSPPPGHGQQHEEEEDQTINFEEQFKSFTNLFTDRFYAWPIFEAVQLQQASSRIYAYLNMYEGQHTLLDVYTGKSKEPAPAMKKVKNWFKTNILGRKVQAPKHLGVCSGDELPLLFKYPDLKIKENTQDYGTSKELVKLWVQFATDETKMTFRNKTWTPVNGPTGSYNLLHINTVPETSGMKELSDDLKRRLQFWRSLNFLPTFNQ